MTIALAFGALFALASFVDPPSDPVILTISIVLGVAFLVWFFRLWGAFWIAVNLYRNPPVEEDFDAQGKFFSSKTSSESKVEI